MILKNLVDVLVYILMIALCWVIFGYGQDWYRDNIGEPVRGGVAVVLATKVTVYLFLIFNVIAFVLPRLMPKIVAILLMGATILWIFLPYHPIRAMAYTGLTCGLSLFAIAACSLTDRIFAKYR